MQNIKSIIGLIVALFVLHNSYCQQNKLAGRWTNGFESYSSGIHNDSLIVFHGGNLHEGGSVFTVEIIDDGHFILMGREPHQKYDPSIGSIGDEIVVERVNTTKVLIIQNSAGEIHEVLREMATHEYLEDLYVTNIINYQLAGKYFDVKSNTGVIFYPNSNRAIGLSSSEYFKFEKEYDYPVQCLTFENNESFYYEESDIGLDIYEGKLDEYEEWKKGKLLRKLKKIEWLSSESLDDIHKSLNGIYSIASKEILIDGILSKFEKSELKVMRNEIFARHGYRFKTKSMQDYFEKLDWYSPEFDDVNDRLTELEKLNVKLIQRFERN